MSKWRRLRRNYHGRKKGGKFLSGRDDAPTVRDTFTNPAYSHAVALASLCPSCREGLENRMEYTIVSLDDIRKQQKICKDEKHHNKLAASQLRVKNVEFVGGMSNVEFSNGAVVNNRVEIVPHEEWVASWDRNRPLIRIDDDVPDRYRFPLAVHESIEKLVEEKYKLSAMNEGHDLAEAIEKEWFMQHFNPQEWLVYSKIIERVHRKESMPKSEKSSAD